MMDFGPQYVGLIRQALTILFDGVSKFNKSQGPQPLPGSQAETELTRHPRPESLVTAWSIATQLIESAGEHVSAFVKMITEPMEPIACWTCVRSMLESCALAAWLFDASADARTRVGRGFALRYEGLEQQRKFVRILKNKNTDLAKVKQRIDDVEQDALILGYPCIRDQKGKRAGIGQRMPSATYVIKQMLDDEEIYRLLSAVAHGHSWAIIQLGFEEFSTNDGGIRIGDVQVRTFKKACSITGLAYLGLGAAKAFAIPILYQCRYFGWNEATLSELLDKVFDHLQAEQHVRFWRKP